MARDNRSMWSERRRVGDNPKPLCMIPFNVSISNARTGNFKSADHPVFVYWVDKQIDEFRIRLIVSRSHCYLGLGLTFVVLVTGQGKDAGGDESPIVPGRQVNHQGKPCKVDCRRDRTNASTPTCLLALSASDNRFRNIITDHTQGR